MSATIIQAIDASAEVTKDLTAAIRLLAYAIIAASATTEQKAREACLLASEMCNEELL